MSRDSARFYVSISHTFEGKTVYRDATVLILGSKQFHPMRTLKKLFTVLSGAIYIVHVSAKPETDMNYNADFDIVIEVED